jgi:hypothetical protein
MAVKVLYFKVLYFHTLLQVSILKKGSYHVKWRVVHFFARVYVALIGIDKTARASEMRSDWERQVHG